jgi:von Willebrand factor type A domain
MVAKLSAGKPAPIIRVGLVAYRDKGDEYVTKVFPFSENIDQVVKDISSLKAAGGGDGPEAVDLGLHAAVKELKWDSSSHTAKLLFLIGDAGPHGYKTDSDWRKDCREAISDGIQINTMGCHGLESYPEQQGTAVFKEIAKLTDGKYESLAYRQEIVDSSGKHSTVVSSAGAMYTVAPGYSGAWKGAVARGMLEKVTTVPGSSAASEVTGLATAAAAPMAMPAEAKSLRAGRAATRGFAYGGAAAGAMTMNSQSRADNNLDELMLGAARDKAEKTLHIGY